jgi:hypothetical protein
MAKLASYRTIYKQDFDPKYSDLVDSLSLTINDSFNEIYSALNNKLTFSDNFVATVATVSASVDSTGRPQRNTIFKINSYQTAVQGIIVIGAVCTSSSLTYPNSGIFIDYTYNSGTVTVNYIKGLPAGPNFSITLIAI